MVLMSSCCGERGGDERDVRISIGWMGRPEPTGRKVRWGELYIRLYSCIWVSLMKDF